MHVHQDLPPVYHDSMPVHQDLTPVYQDSTPVLQDLTPACQDFMPVCQDSTPAYQDSTPIYQDLMPVCQDFVPASQDLHIVKDVCATSDSVSEIYKPFISEGLVSLLHDKVISKKIKILRATGASQSLLLADVLPFSKKSYSGESVLLQGVECSIVNVPLHHVSLTSDLVSGPVTVGVCTSLPIDGVHFLLGNYLAGGKVVPSPVVTDKPKIEEVIGPILEEIPDLYPSCAMTQKAKLSKPPITILFHLNTIWPILFYLEYFLMKIMVIVMSL